MNQSDCFRFTTITVHEQTREIAFGYEAVQGGKTFVFTEHLFLPLDEQVSCSWSAPRVKKTLEGLHLMLGISYWKLFCIPKIEVPYALTQQQAEFWNTVYTKGLGEFFYKNTIDFRGLVRFPAMVGQKVFSEHHAGVEEGCAPVTHRALVPFGGGKDSLVSVLKLEKEHKKYSLFVVNPVPLQKELVEQIGVPALFVQRTIDPQVFELVKTQEVFDGHVPVTAINSWISALCAEIFGYSTVVFSNERSANEGNVEYLGEIVNHQWSKSEEFEELFQQYLREYVTPTVRVYSLLRPYDEIAVVQYFAHHGEKFFHKFSSCNKNFALLGSKNPSGTLWCGECPKCAFAFALLAAFLPKRMVVGIFGKDLYANENLAQTYRELLGVAKIKPFECVGTPTETFVALARAFSSGEYAGEPIIELFEREVFRGHEQSVKDKERQVFSHHHDAATFANPTLSRLEGKRILILGYGREGKATETFLKKFVQNCVIGIADMSDGSSYLDSQYEYDLAIKTPGIRRELVRIPYTTATNIFFANLPVGVRTVGITGSKGKSTTTSLIYAVLKEGGVSVRIAGNIGKPMLAEFMNPISNDEVFVLELSSYMLSDITCSPDVFVFLNVFPEHLDYHGGLEQYIAAKSRPLAYAKSNTVFIYNARYPQLVELAQATKAETRPFSEYTIPIATQIKGKHNRENIGAALEVAKVFGVSVQAAQRAIEQFEPLPHRLQRIGTYAGITFYDDAIATAPEPTMLAIETLAEMGAHVDTIFLGGTDRGYVFDDLVRTVHRAGVRNVVFFPDTGKRIEEAFQRLFPRSSYTALHTKSMEEAVRFAYAHTQSGAVCLLSTASPSYSVWKNFEAKGDEFQKWVRVLGK